MKAEEARKLASEYHGGQWTALYAYASSGYRGVDLISEARDLRHLVDVNGGNKRDMKRVESFIAFLESLGICDATRDAIVETRKAKGEAWHKLLMETDFEKRKPLLADYDGACDAYAAHCIQAVYELGI